MGVMTASDNAPLDSRHVSIWIETSPAAAYAYIADPTNLTQWAAGLADGEVRHVNGAWVASSPMGEVSVEFAPANTFGVVDHTVRLADGQAFYNPMRIVPDGDRGQWCEVTFTVRRQPGVKDDAFEADVAAVTADLETLREILAIQRSR
jgi:hypothetical protein